jgi:hypothetical protein
MKFGLSTLSQRAFTSPNAYLDVAKAAEEAGLDFLSVNSVAAVVGAGLGAGSGAPRTDLPTRPGHLTALDSLPLWHVSFIKYPESCVNNGRRGDCTLAYIGAGLRWTPTTFPAPPSTQLERSWGYRPPWTRPARARRFWAFRLIAV